MNATMMYRKVVYVLANMKFDYILDMLCDVGSATVCVQGDAWHMQAPEVIKRKGTDKAADYWAIGVLIYEMLTGDPPFKSVTGDPWDTFRQALSGRFFCPPSLSDHAKDLIFGLLKVKAA